MANEAIKVYLFGNNGDVEDVTVANATAIAKGTVLKMTSPDTAVASTGTGDVFAGIAATDKAVSDGSTRLGLWTNIKAKMVASGAITVGQKVKTAAPGNYVMAALDADVTASYAKIVGIACETVTDGQTLFVRVRK